LVLIPGTRLGVYEITAHIGQGGMGQVYRATDIKLKRQVAIKILPPSVAGDHDRLARFQREAEVLASLNHPHIAAIYGLHEGADTTALVMELVEGEDLSQRLARGPIRIDEALPIASQIADALEAAHERGIIHRDLKSANIKVRRDDTVKVLDFGLAKPLAPEGAGAPPDVMTSPTITSPAMTELGMILGTAAYMSPEQARGRAVDKRADIWAFGCVLYEMLTAKRPFDGDTIVDVLSAVTRLEPDFDALPPEVPVRVRRVLQLCLRKDVRQRPQAMGDVRLALDGAFETEVPSAAASARSAPRERLAWAACGLALLAATALAVPAVRYWREPGPKPLSGRFNLSLPEYANFALSPSGRLLAYTSTEGSAKRLWIRPLDSLEGRAILGTDDADLPFWSPDEEHLGFFAEGKLKKVGVSGGLAETLSDAPTPRGGTWNRDGVIVFAPNILGPLFRVSENGGAPVPVTTSADPNYSHRYPEFIAGGNRFLFLIDTGSQATSGMYVGSLDGAAPTRVLSDTSHAVYLPPATGARAGTLLFRRQTTLVALPFDGETLQAAGAAVPVAQDVHQGAFVNFGAFAASDTGVLVYRATNVSQRQSLTWIDRATGRQTATTIDAPVLESLALSPNESQVAITVRSSPTSSDIWLHDLQRGVPTRFTFGPGRRRWPVWSSDGRSIVFVVATGGAFGNDFFRKPSNGGAEEKIVRPGSNGTPLDISPDGKLLLYSATGSDTKDDLWLLPLQGQPTPAKYLEGPSDERHAQFSPDGRWIAYASDETGRFEVYVQAAPAAGSKRQISTQGGSRPRWRRDGKELYYLSPEGKLMVVPVTLAAGTLRVGAAERLFDLPLAPGNNRAFLYAPAANGQKFLASGLPEGSMQPVTVWMNWMAGIVK
jgi:Tol biopolymer transport system component